MQTLKFSDAHNTVCRYTLSPQRDVGALQEKFAKYTGKAKKRAITGGTRTYPAFVADMSTSDYVARYAALNNWSGAREFFAPLNTEPCQLYSGEDMHETIDDDAPINPGPDTQAPAAKELPYAGFDATRAAVYRAHVATVATAVAAELMEPIVNGPLTPLAMDQPARYLRHRSAPEFSAPAVRMLRQRIAAAVRAQRAAQRSPSATPPYVFPHQSAEGGALATQSDTSAPIDFAAWPDDPKDPKPTFSAYPYAKRTGRTVVMRCRDDNGYRGRASVCASTAGMRYVSRAHGYVGTPRQAEKCRAEWVHWAQWLVTRGYRPAPTLQPARPSVPIHAARYRPAGPVLRLAGGDPRVVIPARFAPSYVFQGAAQ